jgi:hypothetical protein
MTGLSVLTLVLAFSTRRHGPHGHFGGTGTALGSGGLIAVGAVVFVAVVILLVWLYRRAKRR